MKKNLSYRDKLLELASIYKISEIKNYEKSKKYLTTPQIEHILKKNKVPIPTEVNKSILEIQAKKISKPIFSVTNKVNLIWILFIKSILKVLQGFVKIFPFLGNGIIKICSLISKGTINLLNGIYNFKVEERKANKIFTGAAVITFICLFSAGGFYMTKYITDDESVKLMLDKKFEKKTKKLEKENLAKLIPSDNEKKPLPKKQETNKVKIPKNDKKKKNEVVSEFVLPNLNLKTETVLSLFSDVQYDLNKVRSEKKVKPIYFTQFPKDLDEIKSVKLKKDTFIKIVLPLIVAENEKILDDRYELKKITSKKVTTDKEKYWLRKKLKEYKVLKGDIRELEKRMDVIPVSIALAQAAKESGWGTSRFALEGNAIFGQWTWDGKGIAPLERDKNKGHKILRFPILRASVKAYQNNLNTHKGYRDFREKRHSLRKKNRSVRGLELTSTLDKYAQTGKEYTEVLEKIIQDNKLSDFESVQLTNSVVKQELNL